MGRGKMKKKSRRFTSNVVFEKILAHYKKIIIIPCHTSQTHIHINFLAIETENLYNDLDKFNLASSVVSVVPAFCCPPPVSVPPPPAMFDW